MQGEVWAGCRVRDGRPVAVKVVRGETAEARLLLAVRGLPGVVRLLDCYNCGAAGTTLVLDNPGTQAAVNITDSPNIRLH